MIGDLSFLKGNIQPIILNSLFNGDKYGYEIAKEIKDKTENNYEIKQPTLYSYLKKLEKDELIESYWGAESNGGRRRYYRLTPMGRATFEQYTSQWNIQKSVMEALVDTPIDSTTDIQMDSTLLLGSKEKRTRKKRVVSQDDLDQQADIASKLASLTNASTDTTADKSETPVIPQQPVELEQLQTRSTTTTPTAVQSNTTEVPAEKHSKFEIHQESIETFLQNFDEQASKLVGSNISNTSDDYKSTLFDIVGNQLEDVDSTVASTNYSATTIGSAPSLVEVADTFAKSGIRMRIYNSNTAVYHSKKLMPFSKIVCATSWISYAILALCMALLALVTLSLNITSNIIVATAVSLVLPLAGTAMMLIDPTRKVAKKLNYQTIYTICIVGWLAFVATLLAINTLFLGLKFSNTASLILSVVVPSIFALLPLCAFVVFSKLSKQYVS